jgi:hypothetical protein
MWKGLFAPEPFLWGHLIVTWRLLTRKSSRTILMGFFTCSIVWLLRTTSKHAFLKGKNSAWATTKLGIKHGFKNSPCFWSPSWLFQPRVKQSTLTSPVGLLPHPTSNLILNPFCINYSSFHVRLVLLKKRDKF